MAAVQIMHNIRKGIIILIDKDKIEDGSYNTEIASGRNKKNTI